MKRSTIIAGLAALLGGCASSGGAEAPTAAPGPAPRAAGAPAAEYASFDAWKDGFRVRALGAGIASA
ncbi:MAG: hypothetical protein ACK5MQ_14640, partial [Pikeienuella sp.]